MASDLNGIVAENLHSRHRTGTQASVDANVKSDRGWLLVGKATKPRAGNPFPALDSGLRNPAQKPAFLPAISKIQGVVKV